MRKQRQAIVTIAACITMLCWVAAPAEAKKIKKNAHRLRTTTSAGLSHAGSCGPTQLCCGDRCIRYRQHHRHHVGCRPCDPPVQMVLPVKDPTCCCFVEVPVCIPACCIGLPCVRQHCGLFGRGVVNYRWDCGYRIKIVFDRRGDVTVHYLGS